MASALGARKLWHERGMLRGCQTLLKNGAHARLVAAPERGGVEPQAGKASRAEQAIGIGGDLPEPGRGPFKPDYPRPGS